MGGMWREAKGKQEDTDGSGVSAANKHNPQQAIGSKASENTRHTDHKAVLTPLAPGPVERSGRSQHGFDLNVKQYKVF